ncbi:unnamed protein product [Meganyctiphanes norvegica]|uniref:Uncharacterized protein n=1 Tax=Meganyctiphanes norvegica TaxID=48144 RepID=A0AAV2Q8E0_MEGNR
MSPYSLAIIGAIALILWSIVSGMILLIRQLEKRHQANENDNTGQVLPTTVVDTESPPAYDDVIKSPPPYIIYPGHISGSYPVASLYYCYCGSDISSPCKHQNHSDTFLPSYSEAVNVFTYGTDKHIHL